MGVSPTREIEWTRPPRSLNLRRRPKDETVTPPLLMSFDCLYARGKDLRKRPLRVRRNVLEELVDGQQLVLPIRRLADNGFEAWAQVRARGYEGLVGKNDASPYVEGRRLTWLKVKVPHYREGQRDGSRRAKYCPQVCSRKRK